MTPSDELETKPWSASAVGASDVSSEGRRTPKHPLTAGMSVLAILVSVGSLCAASAVDPPAPVGMAWLRAMGITLLMLGGLYVVRAREKKDAIRVTPWLRAGIIAWMVLGAPVAVGLQTHFRYAPSHLWGGPTTLLALLAIPLGIAGTVTVSHGRSRWTCLLLSLLYTGGAVFLSFFVGFIVAGLHGEAL